MEDPGPSHDEAEGSGGKAIPLVTVDIPDDYDETQPKLNPVKITLEQEALDCLSKFPSPLYVITIVGEARKGKSTFINLLICTLLGVKSLPKENQFQTLAGSDVCTYGTLMYNKPIPHPDGGSYVIVDNEGTDRNDDTITMILSAISTFMSSHIIFNVDKDFGNTKLGALDVTAKVISMAIGEGSQYIFPELTVLLRNVDDKWMEAMDGVDPDFYLENKILAKPSKGIDKLSSVRDAVKKCFTQRRMCLVCTPSQNELLTLPDLPEIDNITPFSESIHAALNRIISTTKAKKINDAVLTAEFLVDSLKRTVQNLVNKGSTVIPSYEIVHKTIAESECNRFFQTYLAQTSSLTDLPTEKDVQVLHAVVAASTLDGFKVYCEKHSVSDQIINEYFKILQNKQEENLKLILLQVSKKVAIAEAERQRIEREIAHQAELEAVVAATTRRIEADRAYWEARRKRRLWWQPQYW